MVPHAILITQPAIDFQKLIEVTHKALGYSPAEKADQARRQQHPVEKFLWCLASIRDRNAPGGLTPNLFSFASFTSLILADEFDTIEILEAAAAMPFISKETVGRGIQMSIVVGTLAQWRDAIVTGTRSRTPTVQALYCGLMAQFESFNLNLWPEYAKKWSDGGVFLLEDKRK